MRIPRSEESRALAAEGEALDLLKDPELARLLAPASERREVDRARQVFVNRNLRLNKIDLIGFDMDYTLAIYHMRRIEEVSFRMTLERLMERQGYPRSIAGLTYNHELGMRGLVVDTAHGNLIKMDRFGHVGRAYHGCRPLDRERWQQLYRHERIRPKNPQYCWIDTLFALPEACLFAGIIELLEPAGPLDYAKLYEDIRQEIDTVHRDNSLKERIVKDLGFFIFKDPELGPALHKLRSGGKRLFLLTNSLWDYTDAVMGYLLDGVLGEYTSWRNYFDVVITGAAKPAFFTEGRELLEVDPATGARSPVQTSTLERGRVYEGGNLAAFEKMTGFAGDSILYVGDHIYGDIVKSKRSSLWRTCMIVQELEDEIRYTEGRQEEISRLSELELTRARLDDEINHRKAVLGALERSLERRDLPAAERARKEEERRAEKNDLDKLRRMHKRASELADVLEADVEDHFNSFWGLLFKEGHENSRFGEQVEQYACIYTSRVSNLLHYSPMQYFRSPRDLMPHEHAGALSGRLAPLGSDGPPRGSNNGD